MCTNPFPLACRDAFPGEDWNKSGHTAPVNSEAQWSAVTGSAFERVSIVDGSIFFSAAAAAARQRQRLLQYFRIEWAAADVARKVPWAPPVQCAVRCGCPTGLAFPHPSVQLGAVHRIPLLVSN